MISIHRLDEVCQVLMGQAPNGEAYNTDGNGWPLIAGAGDFGAVYPLAKKFTTEASRLSQHGDIVLGIRATIGEKVLADGVYCLGRGVAGLRAKPELESRYLWHWLTHVRPELASKAKGATFKQVNRDDIGQLEILLPPLPEQRRIAEVLDRAEALRAKRRAALAQLDTLTQALFLDLFGDPATNPRGWPVRPLGSEIESVRYGTGSPPEYVENGVPFIRATNIKNGSINPKDLVRISLQDADQIPKCKTSFGNLIVVRSGVNTGDCAIIPREYDGAYAAYDLIVELSMENAVFYNFLINSSYGRQCLSPLTRRAALPHLNADQLRTLKFIAPPMKVKVEFALRVTAVEKLKTSHRASLEKMDELFACLQHRAFRGEL